MVSSAVRYLQKSETQRMKIALEHQKTESKYMKITVELKQELFGFQTSVSELIQRGESNKSMIYN